MECECKTWACTEGEDWFRDGHHRHCPQHPSHATQKVQCLICDKELEYEPGPNFNGNVYDGGFMLLSFHYGSRHDQCHGYHGRKANKDCSPMERILACDEIEAFICDECFERKFDKMKGYDVHTKRTRQQRYDGA